MALFKRTYFAVWLIVGCAMLTGTEAAAFTIFGDTFLEPGEVRTTEATIFGRPLRPRLDLNGFFRTQFVVARLDGETRTVIAPQAVFEVNLQLTATERIHAQFRPLDMGPDEGARGASKWIIHPDDRWIDNSNAEPERIWFEGQLLDWLGGEGAPLDITLAGGIIPVAFQNLYWLREDAVGFAVSKNNIYTTSFANLNLIMFGLLGRIEDPFQDRIWGGAGFVDVGGYFLEATFGYAQDTRGFGLSRPSGGLSVTRQLGITALAVRGLASGGNDREGAGGLFVLESETEFGFGNLYVNGFYGTDNWAPLSGGDVRRIGNLFTPNPQVRFPTLTNRGTDSGGGAVGVIFNPGGTVTVTPEFGFLIDGSSRDIDQLGGAVLLQADVASLLYPGNSAEAIERRKGLYGLLLQTQVNFIRNFGPSVTSDREYDVGYNLSLVYRF